MPALGDDVEESSGGPLESIATMLAVISLIFVFAIMISGNMEGGGTAQNAQGGVELDANDVGLERDAMESDEEDELACMECGLSVAAAPSKPRQYYSKAHAEIVSGDIVYIHEDIEYDMYCGILQISALFMNAQLVIYDVFNEYVKPPDDAHWNDEANKLSHGLTRDDPRIVGGGPIVEVWRRFVAKVESHVLGTKVGMMLAWNGKASDCTKMFELTEVKYKGELSMPR